MKVIKEDLSKVIDYGDAEINQKAEKLYDSGIVTRDQLIFSLRKNDIVDLYNKHFDKNGKQTRKSRYNKIKEDIENLERVKDKQTVQNVVMADAEEQSKMDNETKKLIDPMERKNEKAFLGAKKQPEPKEPEEPKATLDESLFEDTNYDISDIKRWVFEDLDNMLEGSGGIEDNLVWVMSSHVNEYDRDWGPEEFHFGLASELKKARDNYINALMKMLFINAPANESLEENYSNSEVDIDKYFDRMSIEEASNYYGIPLEDISDPIPDGYQDSYEFICYLTAKPEYEDSLNSNGISDLVLVQEVDSGIVFPAQTGERWLNDATEEILYSLNIDESLKEDLNEDDFNDFNSDFYNAIADVLYKYKDHEGITRNDIEKAYAFFDSHFYDSDDNENVVDEDLTEKNTPLSYEEAKEVFKARGLNLTKDIYNMILNLNNIPNDMEMPSDLDEAKRDPEDEDLWTLVYEELCPTSTNFVRETKFPDVSLGSRYGEDLIRIDRDNNIVVYGKDDAAFDFARQVCDVYGCTFDGLHKSAQFRVDSNGPDFTMYAKIKVPGYSD